MTLLQNTRVGGGKALVDPALPATLSAGGSIEKRRYALSVGRVRVLVWLLGGIQFSILTIEAKMLVSRGSLTFDFAIFAQAVHLISHGSLNPYSTVLSIPYLANHFELIAWPVAWFTSITHLPVSFVLLILLQALPTALVGPALIGWSRSVSTVSNGSFAIDSFAPGLLIAQLAWTLNVWVYRSDGFDFHYQALQALLSILACSLFDQRRKVAFGFVLIALLMTGDTGAVLVVGVGIFELLRGRPKGALVPLGVGLGWLLMVSKLDMNNGSSLAVRYAYLLSASGHGGVLGIGLGALAKPGSVFHQLTLKWRSIWGSVGGSGFIGLFSPVGIAIGAVVILSTAVSQTGALFIQPGFFQSLPAYAAFSAGILFGWRILAGRPKTRLFLVSMALVGSLGYLLLFAPSIYRSELTIISTPTSRTLTQFEGSIPASDEVIASNGVIGDFADRRYIYGLGGVVPLHGRPLDVVVVPWSGIEFSVSDALSIVSKVAQIPGATTHYANGVFWIHLIPPKSLKSLNLNPPRSLRLSGVALLNPYSSQQYIGTGSGGLVRSVHGASYLVGGDYMILPADHFGQATLQIAVKGSASVQLWNATAKVLIEQRYLVTTVGSERLHFSFNTGPRYLQRGPYSGVGPLIAGFIPPPVENTFELRVFVTEGSSASVSYLNVGIGGAHS